MLAPLSRPTLRWSSSSGRRHPALQRSKTCAFLLHASLAQPGGNAVRQEPAEQATPPRGVRVNKCFRAFASRREADQMVAQGRVEVNGRVAESGQMVFPGDEVTLDGGLVDWQELQAELAGSAPEAAAPPSGHHAHSGREQALAAAALAASSPASASTVAAAAAITAGRTSSPALPPLPYEQRFLYIKYWKPLGVVCTTDARVRDNVVAAISHPSGQRIFPVGRLDKDSTGLLLLTSDGRLPNAMLRAEGGHPKTYRVQVR